MNLDLYQVSELCILRDALEKIDKNHSGVIFTTDLSGAVVGLATDGDIRRCLLNGKTLDDQVKGCSNVNFIWADTEAPRELLLKQLDRSIRVIPLLDKNKVLKGVVCRDNLPIQGEAPTFARSRAPVRVSFGGGGSDLTHFFSDFSGAVINSTVAIYSHATLRIRKDNKIIIHSRDLGETLSADCFNDAIGLEGSFDLILALLKTVQPDYGFELYLHSDFPMKSGLGGSAVVSAAVLGCFNQFRQDRWDLHELAELAYQAERLYLGISGGWQDQYATVFGGFNFMEFKMEQNIVHPLRIHAEILLELEENLVLCDSSLDHDSGYIHDDQRQNMQQSEVIEKVKDNVALTYKMRNHLLRGRLNEFGYCLNQAWQLKRQFSDKISNKQLDSIYETAINNGALGGKLLGAGGGGFFMFYVPAFRKLELMKALELIGKTVQQFRFEPEGMKSWTVREDNFEG